MTNGHVSFSAEQDQFRDIVARFLAEQSPVSEVRRVMTTDSGFDPALWQKLCRDLALAGLHIPEAYGGSGFTAVETGVAMEELGRALTPVPYLASSILAGTAILEAGDEDQKQRLLPDIASGDQIATLALGTMNDDWTRISVSAGREGQEWLLQGHCDYVLNGMAADIVVVAARDSSGGLPGLFVVDTRDSGIDRHPQQSLDETRRLARCRFDSVRGQRLSGDAQQAITRTFNIACVALASEMVGGAQRMLDSAVDYAKMRVQFGRSIGSFQAIKHKCADMLLEVESARSAAYVAAAAAADDAEDLTAIASLAKVAASEAFINAAKTCIQIHGGIGFTWENDTHLWFRRAKVCEMLLGDNAFHRERMLKAWEI
jgi:alkylation response protein AidB-like acyl-CoA dehydrogenase